MDARCLERIRQRFRPSLVRTGKHQCCPVSRLNLQFQLVEGRSCQAQTAVGQGAAADAVDVELRGDNKSAEGRTCQKKREIAEVDALEAKTERISRPPQAKLRGLDFRYLESERKGSREHIRPRPEEVRVGKEQIEP